MKLGGHVEQREQAGERREPHTQHGSRQPPKAPSPLWAVMSAPRGSHTTRRSAGATRSPMRSSGCSSLLMGPQTCGGRVAGKGSREQHAEATADGCTACSGPLRAACLPPTPQTRACIVPLSCTVSSCQGMSTSTSWLTGTREAMPPTMLIVAPVTLPLMAAGRGSGGTRGRGKGEASVAERPCRRQRRGAACGVVRGGGGRAGAAGRRRRTGVAAHERAVRLLHDDQGRDDGHVVGQACRGSGSRRGTACGAHVERPQPAGTVPRPPARTPRSLIPTQSALHQGSSGSAQAQRRAPTHPCPGPCGP